MNVDELLANPATAVGLPGDGIPTHAIVIVEYTNVETGQRWLAANSDADLPSWARRGMLIEAYDVIDANYPTTIEGGADEDEDA